MFFIILCVCFFYCISRQIRNQENISIATITVIFTCFFLIGPCIYLGVFRVFF